MLLLGNLERHGKGPGQVTDIEKARKLFRDAGLAFPTIPEELAPKLKERGKWVFSTRPIDTSPYNLQHYVNEAEDIRVREYAVLSHSGHGANSYAVQYYLVWGALRMFLHLGWGGVYMDPEVAACTIRDCFSVGDQIVEAAQGVGKFEAGEYVTVVASDFHGSYWFPPRKGHKAEHEGRTEGPVVVLTEASDWLKNR